MGYINENDWKNHIDWEFPYKGHALSNPQYIKDKAETFAENGNGWWWNEGRGWTMNWESPMEYHRRKRRARGLK